MGILSEIGRFVGNLFDILAEALAGLIMLAIWAVGFVIDLVTDIFGWINDRLEEFLNDGTTGVDVVQGNAVYDYIHDQKLQGNYTELTWEQMQALRNSAINVAMDANGNITDDQMIRSQGGLSSQTVAQFNGKPIMTIKMPA